MPLCKVPTCWTERTYLEKVLIVSLIFAIVFALAVSSAYLAVVLIENEKLKENETKASENDHVCMTESCISSAASILDNMDSKIPPCEDFYNFACGNFVKKTIVPESRQGVEMLTIVRDSLQEQLKLVLEEPIQTNELKPFKMIKKYYKTCLNVDLIEKDGLDTIRSILKDLGGWPVVEGDQWAESRFDWKELTHKFREIGFSDESLLQVFVERHQVYSDRRVLYIFDPPSDRKQNLHQRVWTEEEVRNAYFRYMVDAAVLLGADRNRSASELTDTFVFDGKISDLSNRTNLLYMAINVTSLQEKLPNFTWTEYIEKLLKPHSIMINATEDLLVNVPYLEGLNELLQTVKKRTLANYMIWRFIYYCAPFLNRAFREAHLKYKRVFTGVSTWGMRWKFCLDDFMIEGSGIKRESLYIAVGALYVRKYFSKKDKENAQEMVLNIYRSLVDTLEHIDWMDAKTRKKALDKAKAMIMNTAYPDEFLDNKKLLQFYSDDIELDNNYLKSILKLNLFDIRHNFKSLREPVNRNDWIEQGQVVVANAIYYSLTNSFKVPVGILQKRTFSNQRPNYLNYGSIGAIIGHEMTHGFDDTGSRFDKNGNRIDWWTPKSENSFDIKSACIAKQYSKYKLPELNMTVVNGDLTLGENIADNGGTATSYKAYTKWVKKHSTEKMLPGLKYTPNQLFWISVANNWCSIFTPESLQKSLKDDTHSPNRFRVIGPLSNYKEFANDFHCPVGSKMNPKQKCKFW